MEEFDNNPEDNMQKKRKTRPKIFDQVVKRDSTFVPKRYNLEMDKTQIESKICLFSNKNSFIQISKKKYCLMLFIIFYIKI